MQFRFDVCIWSRVSLFDLQTAPACSPGLEVPEPSGAVLCVVSYVVRVSLHASAGTRKAALRSSAAKYAFCPVVGFAHWPQLCALAVPFHFPGILRGKVRGRLGLGRDRIFRRDRWSACLVPRICCPWSMPCMESFARLTLSGPGMRAFRCWPRSQGRADGQVLWEIELQKESRWTRKWRERTCVLVESADRRLILEFCNGTEARKDGSRVCGGRADLVARGDLWSRMELCWRSLRGVVVSLSGTSVGILLSPIVSSQGLLTSSACFACKEYR